MNPVTLNGQVQRLHFRPSERMLYLKLTHAEQTHALHVRNNARLQSAIELTTPGDDVDIVVFDGHIDRFWNHTKRQPA